MRSAQQYLQSTPASTTVSTPANDQPVTETHGAEKPDAGAAAPAEEAEGDADGETGNAGVRVTVAVEEGLALAVHDGVADAEDDAVSDGEGVDVRAALDVPLGDSVTLGVGLGDTLALADTTVHGCHTAGSAAMMTSPAALGFPAPFPGSGVS